MPLFDYKCPDPECGAVRKDVLVRNADEQVECLNHRSLNVPVMERLPATPSFVVKGFSAKNLYAGGQTKEVKVKEKNMRVTVKS